ncbi:MAG: DegV family protein [Oscillospiraceae bacterium]|nr:DegV family protein [Oscillospiraceae bacterium]
MSFAIITDTSANLPTPLLSENDIAVVPFTYFIDGVEMRCLDTEAFDGDAFYDAIRGGTRVSTSMVNMQAYLDAFRAALERGEDVLYVGMSSGISGSYDCSTAAAAQLRAEFPERELYTLDTYGASLGEGFLVTMAADLRREGRTAAETFALLEDRREAMCQVFTVDDLMYLRRTGRLSNAAALIGTMLNIKPLLKGNQIGQIVSFDKVRGRRHSVEAIADNYDRLVENPGEQVVGIAQAGCREDAEYLARLLRRVNPPRDILTVQYEPVTGSHVGPGALALFFFGSRDFRARKHL